MQIRKLAAGDRLLDYRILEKIGEGGFGEVFRAEHEVLGRIVAIKVPRDLESLSALRLEGVIQATLDHPAIVKTLEISISHDPPYVVMEHVDGMSLAEALKREGPMSWRRAARILVEAGRALKHAHERGVVHGDVKPGNVLVEPGEEGRVRLTDFGLGRVFEGPRGNVQISRSLELAASGAEVQGTLRYLAPEVQRGEPADERSDLYSWGVLLFETMTGKLPEGREIPSDLAKNVPWEIDQVFEQCFQRRERRPRSLDSSITSLEKLLVNGPRPKGAVDEQDGRASKAIPFRGHDGPALVKPLAPLQAVPVATPVASPASTADALHVLRMLGAPSSPGALPAMPVQEPVGRGPENWGHRPRGAPPRVAAATVAAPPPEVDLGSATRRGRSDPDFLRWRDAFLAAVRARFEVRPAGAGLVAGEGFDIGVGITTEGDPHHRIYAALVPHVDLETSRRFVKAAKQVFEREKGVWEKEVTFVLVARDIQEKASVLSTLRTFSTGWWRRRRAVLHDLSANKIHAIELGCDPRGNPLKRLFFDAMQEAAKHNQPPLLAQASRARRECIRGGFVGIGLALVATTGLLAAAMSVERCASRRAHPHGKGGLQIQLRSTPAAPTPGWNGPVIHAVPDGEKPELHLRLDERPILLPDVPKAPEWKDVTPVLEETPVAPEKAIEKAPEPTPEKAPEKAPEPEKTPEPPAQPKVRFF